MMYAPDSVAVATRRPGIDLQAGPNDLRAHVAARVVSRLARKHRKASRPSLPAWFDPADFTTALLEATPRTAQAVADRLVNDGLDLETLFLGVFTPAARQLGDLWLSDKLSFFDVTRGTGVLHLLLRFYAPAFEAECGAARRSSILLAPVPGEQHVFGLAMVAAFFRGAGWRVDFEPRIDLPQLTARIAAEPYDVIGLSASCSRTAASVPAVVEACRAAAVHRDLPVLVGGVGLIGCVDLQAEVAADAVCFDATDAVSKAETILQRSTAGPAWSAVGTCRA